MTGIGVCRARARRGSVSAPASSRELRLRMGARKQGRASVAARAIRAGVRVSEASAVMSGRMMGAPKFSAAEQRAFKAWFLERYGFTISEAPARLSRQGYASVKAEYARAVLAKEKA